MGKIIIFTHESDIDGIGCLVLAKLTFKDLDYVLAPNVEELELIFRKYIENDLFGNYEKIFITDLALYDPSLTMVAESNLKDKVLVFDHHERAINAGMSRYDFTTIIEEDSFGKKCGTLLFYKYLVDSGLLIKNDNLDMFVEMTRLEDNWEWKKYSEFGRNAHNLAILFNIIGRDNYVSSMVSKLISKDLFGFSFDEEKLIDGCIKRYETEILKLLDEIEYLDDEFGNRFGIVFCNYEYRNDLAEYIRENNNPNKIKYLIIAAMDKGKYGQKSYRTVDGDFNVNDIAVLHGGGGHIKAAAVGITKEQRDIVLKLSKRDGLKFLADSKYN